MPYSILRATGPEVLLATERPRDNSASQRRLDICCDSDLAGPYFASEQADVILSLHLYGREEMVRWGLGTGNTFAAANKAHLRVERVDTNFGGEAATI